MPDMSKCSVLRNKATRGRLIGCKQTQSSCTAKTLGDEVMSSKTLLLHVKETVTSCVEVARTGCRVVIYFFVKKMLVSYVQLKSSCNWTSNSAEKQGSKWSTETFWCGPTLLKIYFGICICHLLTQHLLACFSDIPHSQTWS